MAAVGSAGRRYAALCCMFKCRAPTALPKPKSGWLSLSSAPAGLWFVGARAALGVITAVKLPIFPGLALVGATGRRQVGEQLREDS